MTEGSITTTTTYVLDTAAPLTMVLSETTSGVTTRYWHGLDILAQPNGTTTEYFAYDGLGSARQLVDTSGSVGLAQTLALHKSVYIIACYTIQSSESLVSPQGEILVSSISLDTATALLRISFFVGAITDGLAVIPMVFPSIGSTLFGGNSSRFSAEYRFAMGIGASLMAGWTLLLVWGSIDLIGRRDILVLTLIPVIVGIIASTVIAVSKRVIFLNRVILLWIHLSFVSILFVVSYALSFHVAP